MSYIENRIVHDADAHVMETKGWLEPFADTATQSMIARRDDPAYRAKDAAEIMLRKNHAAPGAFRKEDRAQALDLVGVAIQLVFPTTSNVWLEQLGQERDVDLLYDTAAATNQMA